jgi:ferredoxin--NADP+ reductase
MADLGTDALPLRVAIIGSGPSGFFAADALYKAKLPVAVDMFDRLPTPFGLVRGGVAPDHPSIKKVTKAYSKLAERQETFRFWGNVHVGRDLAVDDLRQHYDALLFCHGAETDRRLGIDGEDLPGSHTATAFVGWYNGHPDYRDLEFDLSQEVAVVIGQGNVAMDVSRILAKTKDELASTDIAQHALEQLAESKVKEIHVIGRRGPLQAKFTPPEIREIGELADCDPLVDPEDLVLSAADQAEHDHVDGDHLRANYATMKGFAEATVSGAKSRRYKLWFKHSPKAILGDGQVQKVVLEKNVLKGEAFNQWSEGTGESCEIDCGLFFRSVGYRGVPLEGLPFSEKKGRVPNVDGRVTDGDDGDVLPGTYVAGWIKRGPSGVIGTNKPDAQASVKLLLEDMASLPHAAHRDSRALADKLADKGRRVVSFEDWQRIDAAEVSNGEANGKPREKFTRIEEMLAVLDG